MSDETTNTAEGATESTHQSSPDAHQSDESALSEQTAHDESGDAQEGSGDDKGTRSERREGRARDRLATAQQENQELRGALEGHLRSGIEALVSDRLADPSSFWLAPGAEVFALVGDDFAPDPEKITELVDKLLARAPQLAAKRVDGGADGGARGHTSPEKASWGNLLKS